MPSSKKEDEFVLTISDNDDLSLSDADSSASGEVVLTNGKKRKREDAKVNGSKKKQKKAPKAHAAVSDDEESTQEERGIQDGVIDPDFEFDLGVGAIDDALENFDGWGNSSLDKDTNGNKKGVDIDEIIARRAVKRNAKEAAQVTEDRTKDDEADPEIDGEENVVEEVEDGSDAETIEFEDDELLAPDTFGANASSEDEADSKSQSDEVDSNSASDDESIASPTAHPDDVASDSDDDSASQASAEDIEETAKREAFFGTESQPEITSTSTTNSFQQFSLSRPLLRGLAALSFSSPTPIQSRTIPIALQGLDIVGSAVTGSGKTAAFLLPILERLLYRPRKIPTTRVAILMPTRELAVQCHNVAVAMARYTDITFAQVVGGFSLREQEVILKKRPDVVIATPGRFIDHMRNSISFAVENLEILVLDEADRMLEDGFADELDEILRTIPKGRQTMLFSATMTESVDKLVRVGMNRPIRVSVDAKRSTVSGLVQEFVRLRPGREEMRLATLCVLCTKVFTERTIIFFRQKKEAHRVRIIFGLLGIKAGELHGSMTQEQRITAVNGFREGTTTHLLATDLASRGLDIKNVLSVINYEAPQSHEIYLHRVGRTARAGKSGRACTIAAEPDRKVVKTAVKSARSQNAKIASRTMDLTEVDQMHSHLESLESDIEEILSEEKAEKALSSAESQLTRGENLVKHEAEIKSRPKRTWFETERDKKVAKDRGRAELNSSSLVKFSGEKKKLSNKDKKRLDDHRERTEGGRSWKKSKGDADAVQKLRKDKKRDGGAMGKGKGGGGGGGGGIKSRKGKGRGKK